MRPKIQTLRFRHIDVARVVRRRASSAGSFLPTARPGLGGETGETVGPMRLGVTRVPIVADETDSRERVNYE